jgi:hypothetical protein
MSFNSFETVLGPVVYVVLTLGLLSLVIGRAFIKRRRFVQAAETLWFVTLGLLVCLGLVVHMHSRRLDKLQNQMEALQEKLLHQND